MVGVGRGCSLEGRLIFPGRFGERGRDVKFTHILFWVIVSKFFDVFRLILTDYFSIFLRFK